MPRNRRSADTIELMRSPVLWLVAVAACGSAADAGADAVYPSARTDTRTDLVEMPTAELDDGAPLAAHGARGDVRYSDAVQKSTHNAYDRAEPLLDQLLYHRIRSLELDVHASKAGQSAPGGDWFVYHEDAPLFRDSSCVTLSSCLRQVAAFHRALPHHEVVTLFIDLKDGFSPGRGPSELDARILSVLGKDVVFTPADALDRCPDATSVGDALLDRCSFPTLADLRGRIVVAVTGGRACDRSSHVMAYVGDAPARRAAFAAPNFDAACPVASLDGDPRRAVFANTSFGARREVVEARKRGLVARIYKGGISGGLDTREEFEIARALGANHLATDRASFDADPWSSTHTSRGFPFRCAGCEDLVEAARVVGLAATSGDLWGTSDSGFFAYDDTEAGAETWSSLVSVPSSHAPQLAKACLVARASDAPEAAYAAVCRPFDGHPPRMQLRMFDGGATTAIAASALAGFVPEALSHVRLVIAPTDGRTSVAAEASADGSTWTTIATTTMSVGLPVRGLAVSSHDAGPVRALFAGTTRTRGGAPSRLSATDLRTRKAIGLAASGSADDATL